MQTFSEITNITKTCSNVVVALGTFDGVHLGHQNIINQAIKLAKSINGTSVVFTFSNHPFSAIDPNKVPLRISNNRGKELDMEALGVDVLMNISFTEELAALSPLDFLKLLRDNLAPKYIVVGPNFSFGYKGKGTSALLQEKGADYGFTAKIQPFVQMNDYTVCSTKIRQLITDGQLDMANILLGRPFRVSGPVIQGDQRGRLLGVPTANLAIDKNRAILPNGVYAAQAYINGKKYKAVANIGTNPTFAGINRHLEVHMLDFKQDIYGQVLIVEFLKKIRDEQKFASKDALVNQIQSDIAAAAEISDLQ